MSLWHLFEFVASIYDFVALFFECALIYEFMMPINKFMALIYEFVMPI